MRWRCHASGDGEALCAPSTRCNKLCTLACSFAHMHARTRACIHARRHVRTHVLSLCLPPPCAACVPQKPAARVCRAQHGPVLVSGRSAGVLWRAGRHLGSGGAHRRSPRCRRVGVACGVSPNGVEGLVHQGCSLPSVCSSLAGLGCTVGAPPPPPARPSPGTHLPLPDRLPRSATRSGSIPPALLDPSRVQARWRTGVPPAAQAWCRLPPPPRSNLSKPPPPWLSSSAWAAQRCTHSCCSWHG